MKLSLAGRFIVRCGWCACPFANTAARLAISAILAATVATGMRTRPWGPTAHGRGEAREPLEPFGAPTKTPTYGQVVTAPAGDNTLNSFTFYVKTPTNLIFRPFDYAWDGNKATGAGLYEGPDTHTTEPNAFQPTTIHTGGVTVTLGHQYVLFFSISKDSAADEGTHLTGKWGYLSGGYSEAATPPISTTTTTPANGPTHPASVLGKSA